MLDSVEQLAYNLELTLEVFTNPKWQPTKPWHGSVGYIPSEENQRLLQLLRQEFELYPWSIAERFHDLQERFTGLLEHPSEELE
jgi:hypothetical protein